MTNYKQERAQKVKEAFWENTEYPDDLDEWNLANALREVINQLQQSPGVIMCADVLELCEELEALK
jgi:3-deoxy-D-arabino-heptulosonate 7-phosphate (DAHP) synthase class II